MLQEMRKQQRFFEYSGFFCLHTYRNNSSGPINSNLNTKSRVSILIFSSSAFFLPFSLFGFQNLALIPPTAWDCLATAAGGIDQWEPTEFLFMDWDMDAVAWHILAHSFLVVDLAAPKLQGCSRDRSVKVTAKPPAPTFRLWGAASKPADSYIPSPCICNWGFKRFLAVKRKAGDLRGFSLEIWSESPRIYNSAYGSKFRRSRKTSRQIRRNRSSTDPCIPVFLKNPQEDTHYGRETLRGGESDFVDFFSKHLQKLKFWRGLGKGEEISALARQQNRLDYPERETQKWFAFAVTIPTLRQGEQEACCQEPWRSPALVNVLWTCLWLVATWVAQFLSQQQQKCSFYLEFAYNWWTIAS